MGIGVNGETCDPSEQAGRVQDSVHQARRMAEQRDPLLQKDI